MHLLIISPGKSHDSSVAEGIEEYQKRLGKRFSVTWAFPPADTKESEGKAIEKLFKKDDVVVLLDERGKETDTAAFAELMKSHMGGGTKRIIFIMGGAYGVSEEIKKRAHRTIKLSSLTFPHMLVRLILIEQLYRAMSIIDGGKYHHG